MPSKPLAVSQYLHKPVTPTGPQPGTPEFAQAVAANKERQMQASIAYSQSAAGQQVRQSYAQTLAAQKAQVDPMLKWRANQAAGQMQGAGGQASTRLQSQYGNALGAYSNAVGQSQVQASNQTLASDAFKPMIQGLQEQARLNQAQQGVQQYQPQQQQRRPTTDFARTGGGFMAPQEDSMRTGGGFMANPISAGIPPMMDYLGQGQSSPFMPQSPFAQLNPEVFSSNLQRI